MDPLHVFLLALLQGVSELFPVSSLGHTVIIPGLLGWNETLQSETFLPLVVTLHLGTSAALLVFFWRDWLDLLRGGLRVLVAGRFTRDVDPNGFGRQLALVVVGTIPAGIIGVLFQKPLEALFASPLLASTYLMANGLILFAAERLWRAQRQRAEFALAKTRSILPGEVGMTLNNMSFGQAALIGVAQSLALLPGISRSGSTMAAGMLNGLSHEQAARFSFLLATPIILAAGVLEVPKLVEAGQNAVVLALSGGVVAGVAAYLSVRFLMRYFETQRLDPFAYYCLGAGALTFIYFALQTFHVLP
jgi:undecaprenyl-diphosphatase